MPDQQNQPYPGMVVHESSSETRSFLSLIGLEGSHDVYQLVKLGKSPGSALGTSNLVIRVSLSSYPYSGI